MHGVGPDQLRVSELLKRLEPGSPVREVIVATNPNVDGEATAVYLSRLIRPLAIVPPTRTLAELLLAMRRERRHIVLVSDGRVPLGVVTLDDVLTAVVGFDRPTAAKVGQTA